MERAIHQELPEEAVEEIAKLFANLRMEFKGRADELIPMLQKVQGALGYLPEQALLEISHLTGLSAAKVYGTATFYAQFHLKPRGRNIIRVCLGTACHVRGGEAILEEVSNILQIKPGDTTPDLKFTLEAVACLGACGLSPTMMINDETYGRLTPRKVRKVLAKYK